MRIRTPTLAFVCILVGVPLIAEAHTRSQSVSQWTITEHGARVVVRVPLLELTRVPEAEVASRARDELDQWLAAYATSRLGLRAGEERCTVVAPPEVLRPAEDRVGIAWALRCGPGARTIESRFLLDVAPAHLHFAQVRRAGETAERILSAREPRWALGDAPGTSEGRSLGRYVWLGFTHIATGLDHLAFLLALLLVGRGGREVVVVVSGFTIGHSVTLAVAALQLLRPEAPAVEALIGLSIALVACEGVITVGSARTWGIAWALGLGLVAGAGGLGVDAVPTISLLGLALFAGCHFPLLARATHPERVRAAVALLFGLIHGLGFGGFLLDVGLPPARVAGALFGFNVGVEIGQLIVVALAWPIVRVLGRGLWREASLGGVTALGFYWFVSRLM